MSDNKSETEFVAPKKSLTTEFYVGIFALAGVLAFGYLAINIGGVSVLNSGSYTVSAEFDNISGLTIGAPVEIAGVAIGKVSAIELQDTTAVIQLEINKGHQLRDDDIASIRTKGIIGDKYLRITPGSSEELIENQGKLFDTESVVDMEDIIGKLIHSLE